MSKYLQIILNIFLICSILLSLIGLSRSFPNPVSRMYFLRPPSGVKGPTAMLEEPAWNKLINAVSEQLDKYLITRNEDDRKQLIEKVLLTHQYLPNRIKLDFRQIVREMVNGKKTIEDLTQFLLENSAMKFIAKGDVWKAKGKAFSREDHIKAVSGIADAFLKLHREVFGNLSQPVFEEIVGLTSRINADGELKEIFGLAVVLHDYARLVKGDHYTEGVVLVGNLLKALGIDDYKTKFVQKLVLYHAWPWNICEGTNYTQFITTYGRILKPAHLKAELDNISKEQNIINRKKFKDDFLVALVSLAIADILGSGDRTLTNQSLKNILSLSDYKNLDSIAQTINKNLHSESGLFLKPLQRENNRLNILKRLPELNKAL